MSGFDGICSGGPKDGERLQHSKQTFPVEIARHVLGFYEWQFSERVWLWIEPFKK